MRKNTRDSALAALLVSGSVRLLLNEHRGRRLAEQARTSLQRNMEGYRILVETSPDGEFLLGVDGRVRMANRRGAQLFGFGGPDAMVGAHAMDLIAPVDRERAMLALRRRTQLEELRGTGTPYLMMRLDGSCFPAEISSSTVIGDRQVDGIAVVVRDIAERLSFERLLQHQALHDPLTELPNRALLGDRLEQALVEARQYQHSLALLLMDLDHFKDVNETFGHGVGDGVLQQIARSLVGAVRDQDTVARLGGDEFGILLPHTDEQGGLFAANNVRDAVSQPLTLGDHVFETTGAVGIAVFPQHGEDVSTLLRHADVAMYVAKQNNTGFAVFDPEVGKQTSGRLTLISELRRAIDRGHLVLHYQPKVAFRSGSIAGVEALVRWNHPERGLVPPDQFIAVAEHSGLIHRLCAWTLDEALRQCRAWHDEGLAIPVAVNLSARNLLDPSLIDLVSDLLARYRVPASRLELELTETSVMADPERSIRVLGRLHDIGVRLSIDDFGTGYSSLAYLKRLPVDEIKIDRSFVLDMAQNSSDCTIVRATISLGHDLGMKTVAEGIEDQSAWDQLTSLQCDLGQGYFLARPLPAADCTTWLRDRQLQIAS